MLNEKKWLIKRRIFDNLGVYVLVPDTSVVVQTNELPFKTCLNFGPSYYRTFDGLEYEFGGMCTYTLLKDTDKGWKVELTPKNCARVSECTKVWRKLHR